MKPAAYILLLVIYYVRFSTSQDQTTVRPTVTRRVKCSGPFKHICFNAQFEGNKKRSVNDGFGQATDLGDNGERPYMQEYREGERRGGSQAGGERESGGFRGIVEGDDLRPGLNRQPSDERQLVDIGNDRRGHSLRSAELDSAIGRLRSLLGTTDLHDVDDRGEEEGKREEEEQDAPKRGMTDRDRNFVLNETQTLLSKILSDIEDRLDSKPVRRSVSRK